MDLIGGGEVQRVAEDGKLAKIELEPYGVKLLAPKQHERPLEPVVRQVLPGHDQRVLQAEGELVIRFDQPMDSQSVAKALHLNGVPVTAPARHNLGLTEFSWHVHFSEGINTIRLTREARSVRGEPLYSVFRSRFRRGADDNILMNGEATYDEALINGGAKVTKGREVFLHHKATGAEFLRVSNDGGRHWGPWEPYQDVSKWMLNESNGWQKVLVQYWADGSAAYFVSGGIDRYIADGLDAGPETVE